MADQPPVPPTTHDFPDHWGFNPLQAINRLDDNIDEVRREQERTAETLRHDIQALDAKFDQKLTALQYWYWGTLVVIVMGFVTLWFPRP
jgi:hypothetical protein